VTAEVRVCVSGGLGNQLFQYAYALASAERSAAKIVVDTRFCSLPPAGSGYAHGTCAMGFFPISATIEAHGGHSLLQRLRTRLKDGGQRVVIDHGIVFDPKLHAVRAPRVLVKGLLQSYRYFEAAHARVQRELATTALLNGLPADVRALASSPTTCAVHIRRGDYLAHSAMHLPTIWNYYVSAMALARAENPQVHFAVFSDDPDWCQAQFAALDAGKSSHGYTIVAHAYPGLNALAEFALLSSAPTMIIANSTFSWWAAWLGATPKRVFAPQRWISGDNPFIDDLIPPTWQKIAF